MTPPSRHDVTTPDIICPLAAVSSSRAIPLAMHASRYALPSTRLRDVYGHYDQAVVAWCAESEQIARLFAATLPEIGRVCRDPNDDHVIATALAVNADIIVTGDKNLRALSRCQSFSHSHCSGVPAGTWQLRHKDRCRTQSQSAAAGPISCRSSVEPGVDLVVTRHGAAGATTARGAGSSSAPQRPGSARSGRALTWCWGCSV